MGYQEGMDAEQRRLAGIAEIRRVQAEREVAFYPLCSDCRFGPFRSTDRDRCEHFAHWQISPDRRLSIPVTTGEARSVEGLCGPEATLFAPYRRMRRVARWFGRRDPVWLMWPALAMILAFGAIVSAFR